MRIMVGGLAAGSAFGSLTSFVNALSSPYAELGTRFTGTVWAKTAKVLSLLMDAGWCWAALAVGMGWLAGGRALGAATGALSLVAASAAYYATDAYFLGEPFALFAGETLMWSVTGLLFGSVLGAVGATVGRPGLPGLLAALTVPLGAAAQMLVMPPRPHATVTPSVLLAEVVVWTAAVLGAGWAIHRFRVTRRVAGSESGSGSESRSGVGSGAGRA
ncbi:hypothetical protein ABZY42_28400 [Streptomyces sp. NPDC006622]|uniref:hypothetical protein n=1 Tax=Streptomyces sp. NPDC006622 TaxID=3155459 RepID=UPI0033BC0117